LYYETSSPKRVPAWYITNDLPSALCSQALVLVAGGIIFIQKNISRVLAAAEGPRKGLHKLRENLCKETFDAQPKK
jgi:hypothetical protein